MAWLGNISQNRIDKRTRRLSQTLNRFDLLLGTYLEINSDGNINIDTTALMDVFVPYIGATANVDLGIRTFTTTGIAATGDLTVSETLILASGSITDTTGAITFGDENLSTTGTLSSGTHTIGTLVLAEALITDTTGAISFGDEDLSTTGIIDAGDFTVSGASLNTIYVPYTGATSNVILGNNKLVIGHDASTDYPLFIKPMDAATYSILIQDLGGINRVLTEAVTGAQIWQLYTGTSESGRIVYATPGSKPAIFIEYYNSGEADPLVYRNRFTFRHDDTVFRMGFWDDVYAMLAFHKGSKVQINWGDRDFDFQVSGDTDTNLFYCDAGNDRVGISTSTPTTLLTIRGNTTLESVTGGGAENLYIEAYSTTDANTANICLRKSHHNTVRTHGTTVDGESLGKIHFQGSAAGVFSSAATIECVQNGPAAATGDLEFDARTHHFNPRGVNQDFRIQGNTDTALFYCDGGGNKVGISTLSPDVTFEVAGTSRFGASATNYAQFAADGELTLVGTAKTTNEIWLGANGVKAPPTKPAVFVDHGISGAWEFSDGTDDTIVANIQVPSRMDRAVAPSILIGWSAAGANPGNCEWQVEYLWTAPNENTTAVAQETLPVTVAASATTNGLIVSEITGVDVPSSTDRCLHLRIKRLAAGGNDTITGTVELHGICMNFTSNKLGTAT